MRERQRHARRLRRLVAPLLSVVFLPAGPACAQAADAPAASDQPGQASHVLECSATLPWAELQPEPRRLVGDRLPPVWQEARARRLTALTRQPDVVRVPRSRWWMRPDPKRWPQVFAYYATHTLNPASTGFRHWFE